MVGVGGFGREVSSGDRQSLVLLGEWIAGGSLGDNCHAEGIEGLGVLRLANHGLTALHDRDQ